ncbi:MAG TPA: translation initiation factor IF-3 [Candidatus Dormibacteraeota bacterium]|nr:translation initiation factor IF-3 [Candidatus Dormibacteraeota bacterium]
MSVLFLSVLEPGGRARRSWSIAFKELRVNEQIRVPNVRLIDERNEQLGVLPTERARQIAAERELDLVEVAPQAAPPVCRLMDYGRFRFDARKKEAESRRRQSGNRLKQMNFRPKIGDHDYQTKLKRVREFLVEGDKVKVTIWFRGREMVHQDIGRRILERMAVDLADVAHVERSPLLEGKNMSQIMGPLARPGETRHTEDGEPAEASVAAPAAPAPAAPAPVTPG